MGKIISLLKTNTLRVTRQIGGKLSEAAALHARTRVNDMSRVKIM